MLPRTGWPLLVCMGDEGAMLPTTLRLIDLTLLWMKRCMGTVGRLEAKCAGGGQLDPTWMQRAVFAVPGSTTDQPDVVSMFGSFVLSRPNSTLRDTGMGDDGPVHKDLPKNTAEHLRPLPNHPELEVIRTKDGETWVNEYRIANFRTLDSGRVVAGDGFWGVADLLLVGTALWLLRSYVWEKGLARTAGARWADIFEVRYLAGGD